jgi:hypothetical protein
MAQQYHLRILSDLLEQEPADPLVMTDPCRNSQNLQMNIETLYRLIRWSVTINDRISGLMYAYYLGQIFDERLSTPSLRRQYRNVLSKHYLETCVRVYNLFKVTRPQQIYRTKQTSFWMFRKVKRTDYVQLLQDAITLL